MNEEDKTIINIHLHGSDGQDIDESTKRFKLHSQIVLVGKLAFISLTEFQCLNSIFNINETNNLFLDQIIEPGFYHTRELLKTLQLLLPAGLDVFFNENTLRFQFQNITTAFTLTGTILEYLGITNDTSTLINGVHILISSKPFDLYKRAHSVYVISKNLRTSSNASEESSTKNMSEKLGKIDIANQFGEYIVYYSQGASNKSIVFDNSISTIDIQLVNDFGDSILMDNDFSLSLKLEVYDLKDNAWLEEMEPNKKGLFDSIHYPIINEQEDIIQMKIDELEELKKEMKKNKKNISSINETGTQIQKES